LASCAASTNELERRKLGLEVEIHALEREKDEASKERLENAKKAIAELEDQLGPLKREYENEKHLGDQIHAFSLASRCGIEWYRMSAAVAKSYLLSASSAFALNSSNRSPPKASPRLSPDGPVSLSLDSWRPKRPNCFDLKSSLLVKSSVLRG
jgi:hypothetical protein